MGDLESCHNLLPRTAFLMIIKTNQILNDMEMD